MSYRLTRGKDRALGSLVTAVTIFAVSAIDHPDVPDDPDPIVIRLVTDISWWQGGDMDFAGVWGPITITTVSMSAYITLSSECIYIRIQTV